MSELPRGWVRTTLDATLESLRNGVSTKPTGDSGVPILRISAVRPGSVNTSDIRFLHGTIGDYAASTLCPGDLLFTRYNGNPALVGACGVVPKFDGPLVYPDKLIRARVNPAKTLAQYVSAAMQVGESRRYIDDHSKTAAGQVGISGKDLKQTPLLLAPLPEQRRIVTKIEALQTRSRAAREALDAVGPLLEKFRQSVLSAAFRGELTADWRKKNPNVEPASVLLERIRKERRQRWEQDQLAKMKAKGKAPKDARWKAKYEEPKPVDTEGLPELPEGWCWASLLELSGVDDNSMTDGPFGSNLKSAHYVPSGVRVVRLGNLGLGVFKDTDQSFVTDEHFQTLRRHEVFPGDLLIAALAEPVGRCCELPAHAAPALVKADCIRFAPSGHIDRKLVLHWMNSPPGLAQCEALSHGIGRLRINMANLRLMPVALPPREEQALLVDRVDRALRELKSLGDTLRRCEAAMPALDQSVLATAFRGELVPQDPNDEPAAALLAKIHAATPSSTKPTKRGRKPKAS